jgi:hypothetical protein
MRPQLSDKRLPPYAVGTVCGHYAYSAMDIYNRCSQGVDKKRCKGRYRPALMRDDWKECADCGRTGRVAAGKCRNCAGVGWLYVDRHPKGKQKEQTVQLELPENTKIGPQPNRP